MLLKCGFSSQFKFLIFSKTYSNNIKTVTVKHDLKTQNIFFQESPFKKESCQKKKKKKWGSKLYKTLQNSLRLNCRLLNLFHVKILKLFEKRPFLMDWEFLVAFLKTQKNGHFSKTGISNFAQKGVFFIYICHIFQQPFSKMNNFQMKILNKSENFTLIVYIIYIYIHIILYIYKVASGP